MKTTIIVIEDQAPPPPAPKPGRAGIQAVQRATLAKMGEVLNSWIESAKEDHEVSGHRDESTGEKCWCWFQVEDIRSMIMDVVQELGVEL